MKTANDYAQVAIQIGQMAKKITPPNNPAAPDPFDVSRRLAVFHLRAAASQMRAISRTLAKQEPAQAVNEHQQYNTGGSMGEC